MGFWSFIRRKVHETPSERPEVGLRETISDLRDRLSTLESEHRKDRLELLDTHERVKTSLAKMARRAREVGRDPSEDPGEAADASKTPPPLAGPRVSLISRRSR